MAHQNLLLLVQEALSLTDLLNGPELAPDRGAASTAALTNGPQLGSCPPQVVHAVPSLVHSLDDVSIDGAYLDDMWDELGDLGLDAHEPEM